MTTGPMGHDNPQKGSGLASANVIKISALQEPTGTRVVKTVAFSWPGGCKCQFSLFKLKFISVDFILKQHHDGKMRKVSAKLLEEIL